MKRIEFGFFKKIDAFTDARPLMNILIIPTNDWTRAPGAGHINEIAEELAQRGHNVYAWNFNLYSGESVKRKARNVKLLNSRTLRLRDPALFFSLNALWQTPGLFTTIRKLKIDVIINENILSGLMAFVAAGHGVLKVFDFSDYFPESASVYYQGSSQIKKLVEVITLAITKLNVKFSNVCLGVCQALIERAISFDKSKPSYLVTNGAHVCDLTAADFSQKHEISLVVMGVIDNWLDLETPVQALKKLKASYPNLKLVIIGPWQSKIFRQQFEDYVGSLKLGSSVQITGYVSKLQLQHFLHDATCCVMPYKLDKFYSLIRLPEKLFVYSAYGKPILSTYLPEVVALKPEHIYFYRNADELIGGISNILNQQQMLAELQLKAQEFAKEHDFTVLAKQLEKILKVEWSLIQSD